MANYIDGFVLPVSRDRLHEYKLLVEAVAEIWKARDLANDKVAADPRMIDLIKSSNAGFDAKRMAYGGFQLLAQSSSNTNAG